MLLQLMKYEGNFKKKLQLNASKILSFIVLIHKCMKSYYKSCFLIYYLVLIIKFIGMKNHRMLHMFLLIAINIICCSIFIFPWQMIHCKHF